VNDKQPFPPGTLVRLRSCPHGQPGRVEGTRRGKVEVHWPDLDITRRHKPEALMAAVNPYTRLIKRMDEDNRRIEVNR
jgi:hypothetical protein